jgi:hypothetical protein
LGSPNEIDRRFVDTIDAEDFTLRTMRDRGPIPQPGAVSVIFTSTFVSPSGFCTSWQS